MRYFALCLLLVMGFLGCTQTTGNDDTQTQVITGTDDKIYIVDRTNKKWDITHAVNRYKFNPQAFQYGVGPRTISPIIAPEYFCPGDPGRPGPSQDNLVIGTSFHGEQHAYPINILKSFEIVDETFDSTHVAVAY